MIYSYLRKKNLYLAAAITSLALSACSSLIPDRITSASDWQAGNENDVSGFDSSGRLAIKDQGKGSYANFSWQNTGSVQTIEVKTPLGNSVGVLCTDSSGVIAEDSKGQVITAASIEELSQRMLGFVLPFDHLNQWVQGYWIADEPYQLLPNGKLKQSGWIIQRQQQNGSRNPRIVLLNNARFDIRLVFDEYTDTDDSAKSAQCELRQRLS
ncbi:outer membrane lipoprotein LolB [Snodgrassella alvi]|uniref:lipoprotein insertase outer membrane protein LolB n=1 Tax=Snodgrassella TaxID=1193515 RepID=UPI0009FD94B4|nr:MULTISPECIES: lipoprotein insertase outer membrane protein LolB [Snodgrassella]MBI0158081.1 outer membrane lipoprotein LolB [Snodgrassella sp. W6238H11]MBI0160094.1 outer membrane lipoprotein LolB [Snodgrassella sp. W6238H14]ORF24909.1 outer membrane lipoprotein LolB [Snodgrassella alvi]ORF31649.1 outer membrane lipoprotein LolB [Snodgrassella alvi]ORF34467.1 outer membrane lipoprotein LolB [Snodgrassella alvi]